jgi:arsenate reductase (thioredoxin)
MTKILFLCPHNAAKSILAAAYTKKLAEERGLELIVDTAGTEPSEHIAPAIVDFLGSQGLNVSYLPRKVTREDLASASQIISMGCDLKDLPLQGETIENWNDVPPVSQNLQVAWQTIQEKVDKLLEKLERESR